jgi:two-component system, NtrC family, sensor kinase
MGQTDGPEPLLDAVLALGNLSSSVGHNLINGFSAIVSNAEILRLSAETYDPADAVAVADAIVRTALEASDVARRLIDFTRLYTTGATVPVDLERLGQEVVAAERARAPAGVSWAFQWGGVPPIQGRVDHLRVMLHHLLANAREALPEAGGTITLSTTRDPRGWVVLEVGDTGVGMTPEVLARASEPFFTTKPDRFGVGLTVANGIWRRHRGTFTIRSQEGQGTQVRLGVEPQPSAVIGL